jgi:hypothetical protein
MPSVHFRRRGLVLFFLLVAVGLSVLVAYLAQHLPEAHRTLVWLDRAGTLTPATEVKQAYREPRLSPDGQKLAFVRERDIWEVWTFDFRTERFAQVSPPGVEAGSPVWGRDGRITFSAGPFQKIPPFGTGPLVRASVNSGPAREELLASDWGAFPFDWSPDNGTLLFGRYFPSTGWDIWALEPPGPPRELIAGAIHQGGGHFSPDGRWIAYISTESGQSEVYVQPYPGPGERTRVSTGCQPVWSADGQQLFYREGPNLVSVRFSAEPDVSIGTPVPFGTLEGSGVGEAGLPAYDVALDGRVVTIVSDTEPRYLKAMRAMNDVLFQFKRLLTR